MRRRPRWPFTVFIVIVASQALILVRGLNAHDIPKQRVDRTIQLIVSPGLMRVEYALELDDTTIAADLRRLKPGPLPVAPEEWLDAYGRLVAPRVAAALILDGPKGLPGEAWHVDFIDRKQEQHSIYQFHLSHRLPKPGAYRFKDSNFLTSEGLSRLGVMGAAGEEVSVKNDADYPTKANAKPYEPVWLLDGDALKRTRQWSGTISWSNSTAKPEQGGQEPQSRTSQEDNQSTNPILAAFLLGVWHTLQPGHGKTWLAAISAKTRLNPGSALSLIAGWVASHFAVIFVLVVAALMLAPESLTPFSLLFKQSAGLLIAAPAAYRLGVSLRRQFTNTIDVSPGMEINTIGFESPLSAGLTAGLVPCWEANGLLLLGVSAGHPVVGLKLLGAFIAGGLVVMILMIAFATIASRRLYRSQSMGYVFMIGLDAVVLACGLRLLLV